MPYARSSPPIQFHPQQQNIPESFIPNQPNIAPYVRQLPPQLPMNMNNK